MNALDIENISYSYRTDWLLQKKEVLHNVTLSVSEGETFGFIGHNGAGKTTTIKCILNLIKPALGTIKIFGTDSKDKSSRKNVGFLPEQPYFYDNLTVKELLQSLAALSGVKNKANATTEALELVKLPIDYLKSPLRSLSKGLLQRVAMAGAIIHQPKLLILDEPFSGLDPIGRNDFATLLHGFKEKGTTIFLSSHILNDIENLTDRVAILKKGSLLGIYSSAEIKDNGEYELCIAKENAPSELAQNGSIVGDVIKYTYQDERLAKSALAQALALGAEIKSYQKHSGTLEELFIKLNKQD